MSQQDLEGLENPDQTNASQQKVEDAQDAGESHKMSIALTIGATIAAIGLILLLYGLFGHADYSRSDGININLWWGLVMFVFGLVMATGGYISSRRPVTH
jgi:cation transport ATPase